MKKILSVVMCLVIVFSAFAFPTYASGNGVQSKLDKIKAVYPTGSYFTSTGKAHAAGGADCPDDCNICKLQGIPARGGLPAGNTTNAGTRWQCYAFASYVAYIVFGDARVESWGQVSINNARVGDIIYFNFNHWGVYLYTEGSKVVVYDGNYDYNCGIRYGSKYSIGSVSRVYHSSNYDTINGQSDSHTTHSYDTYVYYWAAHPHYNCYKCSCGEIKENINEPRYISSCSECNAQITQIPEDTYYIRNKADNLYMSVFNALDTELNTVHNYDFCFHNAQAFNIYSVSDGYEIMPVCSTTRVVNPFCWEVVSGKTVNLYQKTNESSQWWKFQAVNGGYVIRNVQNPNVCITPVDATSMIVSEYTGADNQIWYLEKVCTVAYDGNGGANVPTSHITRAGYDVTLSIQTPTKDGYMFLGWSTDKNATEATWDTGATTKFSDSTTLYAVWEKDVVLPTIGNVDNNDTIDATDALQILQAAVGKISFTSEQTLTADVNGNGEIDATDALLVLQYAVGKITKFPVEE